MKNFLNNFYNGFTKAKTAFCVCVLLLYIVLAVYGGANLITMTVFGCIIIFYVFIPGRFINSILKFTKGFNGADGMAEILLGTGFFCALYCVSIRLGLKPLLAVLPPVMSIVYLFIDRKNIKIKKIKISPLQQLIILLIFALIFLYTFATVIKSALPTEVGDTLLNPDMLWNIGNANSFKIRFIPEDIRYSGVQLHYHYLTELFAGAISWLSGISAYNIIAFYMQPWVLLRVVYCLYNFGLTYYENQNKAVLFTFSMFVFGCGSMWNSFLNGRSIHLNDNAYHIITNVNSQATAVIFLCIFSSLFIQMMRKNFDITVKQFVLWISAFFMLSFAKGPVAAIVAIGGVITLFWLFVQRKVSIKAPLSGVVLGITFFVIYSLFFASGANTSMALNIWGTLDRTIFAPWLTGLSHMQGSALWYAAHIGCMFIMVLFFAPLQGFLYYVGLVKDVKNLFRLDGERLWLNSMVAGGFMAFFLFSHYALSQVYFAFIALFFMHLMAVETFYSLKSKNIKCTAGFMAAVGVITTLFIYVNIVGSGARFLRRNLGVIEKYPYNVVVNADDRLGMEYLNKNTGTDTLFATNRIHSNSVGGDGISNVYSALSGRQSYMEGYAYALTNMGVPYYVVSQRLDINNRLFSGDITPQQIKYLCETTGITHLVFSTQLGGDDTPISDTYPKVFDSETVRIYATGVIPFANHPLYQEELARYGEGIKE